MDTTLNTNSIAFIGLCNEYCVAVEQARETDRDEFISNMLRLLPRIYIAASDLAVPSFHDDEAYLDNALDEDYYDALRRNMEALIGEEDTYLEVFEEDMKYSDTPVAASISEGLADIFQVLFNFISTIRDTNDETVSLALLSVRDDFRAYWSATLCNILRALNHIKMTAE
jgi:hypothetical protein